MAPAIQRCLQLRCHLQPFLSYEPLPLHRDDACLCVTSFDWQIFHILIALPCFPLNTSTLWLGNVVQSGGPAQWPEVRLRCLSEVHTGKHAWHSLSLALKNEPSREEKSIPTITCQQGHQEWRNVDGTHARICFKNFDAVFSVNSCESNFKPGKGFREDI